MQINGSLNKYLFLLGGYDLEMLTIRQVLDEQAIAYVDHQLRWDNARVSNYQKELDDALNQGYSVFGIELREDIPIPSGYRRIDHHNELTCLPSALEQVMSLLHLPMDRYQQLVAANDKAYIPGMLELDATKEEIAVIRRADRKAQGVTAEDELSAEKAIAQNSEKVGDLLIVHAFSSRFSPICDRLFPYRCLLVYTDSEWMYYGKGATRIRDYFEDEFLSGKLFCGGGENGYVGIQYGAYSSDKIQEMVEHIKIITNGNL